MDKAANIIVTVSYASDFTPPITGADVQVEAIDTIFESCRLRLLFRGDRSISQALSDEIEGEILCRLVDFEDVEGLFSLPDYHFSCATLSLRGLSVFGSKREKQSKVVTFRWSKVEGSILSVLRECPDALLPPQTENTRLNNAVMCHVLEAIFDLPDTKGFGLDEAKQRSAIKGLINDFISKRDELFEQGRMLKKYIEHEASGRGVLGDSETNALESGLRSQRFLY